MQKIKIGIIGLGFVGGAMQKYFEKKPNYQLFLYDKYKNIGSMDIVNQADYIYVCVPTPHKNGVGCDTSIVEDVILKIHRKLIEISVMKNNTFEPAFKKKTIIIKSTIIPGTTDRLQKKFPEHKVLFNPEFLTAETADQDFSYPDRQIVGYTDKSHNIAKEVLLQLPLAPFERIVPAFIAEFAKYGGNTWFSVKVAKNNELYDLFKKFGGSDDGFLDLVNCMVADKRIDRTHMKIWHKGKRGYSGFCLPKDTKALLELAKDLEVDMPVLRATDDYNDKLLKQQGLNPLNANEDKKKKNIA